MIWRERSTLLTVLGILLVANVIFFFTYRVQYESRIESLETRLETAESELERARSTRARADGTFQGYRQVEKDVEGVYNEHWSTQAQRLTALIAEVKRLAAASSLTPASYNFDLSQAKSDNVAGRRSVSLGANEVGIGFTVQGTYQQIRRLINLLELSRQFVIIDRISLAAAEGDQLTLNLHLKTLFRDGSADAVNDRL